MSSTAPASKATPTKPLEAKGVSTATVTINQAALKRWDKLLFHISKGYNPVR